MWKKAGGDSAISHGTRKRWGAGGCPPSLPARFTSFQNGQHSCS
ncbi:hypothetical protein HMPREF1317_0116 [Schaalia georgiae F0490]|uniref:Uncharacterized protein n=1 Tax=Schaalia georgiae F0490 TaxID=1125717 RepID=J1GQS1_9ACTO|nr:hypothetical protein HMPREF1317_0116 [Schaalia georgiae F0490]